MSLAAKFEYVIDFDGFRDVNNKLIPKELTIVNVTLSRINTYLFHAPLNSTWHSLPSQLRRTNQFVSECVHGIEYSKGEIAYECIYGILNKHVKNSSSIYCNGTEKCSVLSQLLMGKNVTNLRAHIIPYVEESGVKRKVLSDYFSCNNHTTTASRNNRIIFSCSMNKALYFTQIVNIYNELSSEQLLKLKALS